MHPIAELVDTRTAVHDANAHEAVTELICRSRSGDHHGGERRDRVVQMRVG